MNKCMEIKEKIENTAVEVGATAMVKATNAVNKLSAKRMKKLLTILPIMLIALSLVTIPAFAESGATSADSFIDTVVELLKKWIPRLGGMIVVVGGIQFGIGFKDDNADGKTRGMQCMVGGAIVAAIGALVDF